MGAWYKAAYGKLTDASGVRIIATGYRKEVFSKAKETAINLGVTVTVMATWPGVGGLRHRFYEVDTSGNVTMK